MTCHVCPQCGAALEAFERIEVGALTIDYGGALVAWQGRAIPLTTGERLIVIAIAGAGGAWVRNWVLAEATGYAGNAPAALINTRIGSIRNKFRAADPAFDRIESGFEGRRWRVED